MNITIKQIQEKIEENLKENRDLRSKIEKIKEAEYSHYIGKCYRTSATSAERIIDINYIDEGGVTFETLSIYGGKHVGFEIEIKGSEIRIRHDEFEDYFSKEISKKEFVAFINEAILNVKNKI